MPSRTICLALGLVALALALPAFAGKVYQWKDANGVTHYSDAPPPAQQGVQHRQLKDKGPVLAQIGAKPTEEENCATARKNVEQLKGNSGPVGFDANGDGQLDKEMTAEERSLYVQQTELMLRTYCNKPAAKP
ncbi:DUF4124 domain-containing protein [Lysobacter tyrosinilyticus]